MHGINCNQLLADTGQPYDLLPSNAPNRLHWSSDYNNPRGTYDVHHSRPSFPIDFKSDPSATDPDRHRFERQTNETFSESVDQMQKIARVINGIALQQGLANGSIQSVDLISELLNIGSISEINSTNTDEIKQLVKNIQDLLSKVGGNDELTRIENRMKVISKVMEEAKGVEKLKAPNLNYLNAVKTWENLNVDWDPVDTFFHRIISFLEAAEDIERGMEKSIADRYFDPVKNFVNTLLNTDIAKVKPSLVSSILRDPETSFGPLLSFHRSMRLFDNKVKAAPRTDEPLVKSLAGQMKSIGETILSVRTSLPIFNNLHQIFVTRHHRSGNRILNFTSGLHNGFSDLDVIFNDLKDPWIQSIVNGSSDNLEKALNDLRDLAANTRAVDSSIGPLSSEESKTMNGIYSTISDLLQYDVKFDSIASSLDGIQKAVQNPGVITKSIDDFGILYTNILTLASRLKSIDTVVSVTTALQTDNATQLAALNGDLQKVQLSEYTQALKKLKSNTDYQDLVETIRSLKPSLEGFNKTVSIVEPVKEVIKNYDTVVAEYVKDSDGFMKVLNSLRSIPELKSIDKAIDILRKTRSIQIESFDPVAEKLEKARPKLKELQESIVKIKNTKSRELDALKKSKDVTEDSKNIGSVTRVFRSMKMVEKVNLEQKEIALDSNTLDPLNQELNDLYTEIDAIKGSVNTTISNLSSIFPIFELVKNTKGLPTDFMAIAGSIRKMPDSKEQKDLIQKLEKLDTLGLNYASHLKSIDPSKKSLQNIDQFFLQFAKLSTPIAASAPSNGQPPPQSGRLGSQALTGGNVDKNSWSGQETLRSIAIPAWICFCVFGAMFVVIGVLWRKVLLQVVETFEIDLGVFTYYIQDVLFQTSEFSLEYDKQMEPANAFKLYFESIFAYDHRQHHPEKLTLSVKGKKGLYREEQPLSKRNRIFVRDSKMFKSNFLHGNIVKYPNGFMLGLLQAPQDDDPTRGLQENIPQFYWSLMEHKSEFVVCLSKIGPNCSQYFPLLREYTINYMGGKVMIKCMKVEHKHGELVTIRTLAIEFEGKKEFFVKHIHFVWPDEGLPSKAEANALVGILNMIDSSEKAVFMHCTNGLGPSGVMALSMWNMLRLNADYGKLDQGSALKKLRETRDNAILTKEQYMLSAIISFKYIVSKMDKSTFCPRLLSDTEHLEKEVDDILDGKATWILDLAKLHHFPNEKKQSLMLTAKPVAPPGGDKPVTTPATSAGTTPSTASKPSTESGTKTPVAPTEKKTKKKAEKKATKPKKATKKLPKRNRRKFKLPTSVSDIDPYDFRNDPEARMRARNENAAQARQTAQEEMDKKCEEELERLLDKTCRTMCDDQDDEEEPEQNPPLDRLSSEAYIDTFLTAIPSKKPSKEKVNE